MPPARPAGPGWPASSYGPEAHPAAGQRKTRGHLHATRIIPGAGEPAGRRGPGMPGHRAFRIFRVPYFFLAARPRPAGAARNEIPVRMAFC